MHEDGRPQHWTRLEFAYNEMARAAGVGVAQSTLLGDGELAHFMSRRFDREGGRKIHLHSLCGMRHADYNEPRSWSYELYFRTCLGLGLGMDELCEAFRRMVFNVVARNQDDHSKNVAFLKDDIESDWRLAPAFDVTYAHGAGWTLAHQMSVNGRFDAIGREDLDAVAELYGIRRRGEIIDEVREAVRRWPEFAERAELDAEVTARVGRDHDLLGD
jgi:serine/threonine-protein kinase HipA